MNAIAPTTTPVKTVSRETAVFFDEKPAAIPDWNWQYWLRVDPKEIESGMFARLVLNRAIRDRGGLPGDKTVTAHVYIRELNSKTAHWTEFKVTRT